MDSEPRFRKPDFGDDSNNHDLVDKQIAPKDATYTQAASHEHANTSESLRKDEQEPTDTQRHGSVATAVEEEHHDHKTIKATTPMDKIETAQSADIATGTVKEKKKKQLYLHHRNQKAQHKQFSTGSVFDHLPFYHKHHHDTNTTDEEKASHRHELIREETHAPTTLENFKIMFTTFPYWNMAFWSGFTYTIGSALFTVDSAFSFCLVAFPKTEFSGEDKWWVPMLFFFGACLFQVGGVVAYLEAVNDGSFAGAAMKRLLEGHQDIEKELLDTKLHTFFGHLVPHHHRHSSDDDDSDDNDNKIQQSNSRRDPALSNWESITNKDSNPQDLYDEAKEKVERRGGVDHGPTDEKVSREYLTWRWWPTSNALWTYHLREMGYVATTIQLFGVTLYGVTSIVILPGIYSNLVWWQKIAAYWVEQLVGSVCFLIASIMFTIMAQEKWWKPKINTVSWWIGFWAIGGSVGFTLSAIFGFYEHEHTWAEYQSSLCATWGSFLYMVGALFQWYEAINVNVGPVLAFPNNRTPVLLRPGKPKP